MSNKKQLLDSAVEAAKKAIQYDEAHQIEPSIYFYEAAAKLLEQTITEDESSPDNVKEKIAEYKKRAEELKSSRDVENKLIDEDEDKKRVKQCYFLLQQAIQEDESGDKEEAIELYAQAVEYITQYPNLMKGELKQLIMQGLERAETLKGSFCGRYLSS